MILKRIRQLMNRGAVTTRPIRESAARPFALDAQQFAYRPEIDGLRAVAVIMVLLYHAGLGFDGGFVGVDVFFVISGYLITGLILRDLQRGQFRLREFWARRIRRIVPASTVVAIASLVAGYFALFPSDYEELADSLLWQQAFIANVYFWKESGYFAGAAEIKPLLHYWSLAVEEQFYVFLPPIMLLLFRRSQRWLAYTVIATIVVSLLVSIYGVANHPSAAYFLLPTRAWELLVGAVLWFLPPFCIPNRMMSSVLTIAGLASIGYAGLVFNSDTPFPGTMAILPCSGAAFFIFANANRITLPAAMLTNRPLVATGLISYSLYLWHWPLLAFYRYWFGSEIAVLSAVILLLAATALATLSYHFVEKPFRKKTTMIGYRRPFGLAAGSIALLVVMGIGVKQSGGMPWRVPESSLRYHATVRSAKFLVDVPITSVQSSDLPSFGDGSEPFVVWGDSHAMAYIPGLEAAANRLGMKGFQATYSSNPPVLDMVYASKWGLNERGCHFNEGVIRYIESMRIPTVVLAANWKNYAKKPDFEGMLRRTLDRLADGERRVIVVLDVADQVVHVPRHYARKAFFGYSTADDGLPLTVHRRDNKLAESIIRRLCDQSENVVCIDPASQFVRGDLFRAEIDGKLMYRNTNHLSVEGGLHLANWFADALRSSSESSEPGSST